MRRSILLLITLCAAFSPSTSFMLGKRACSPTVRKPTTITTTTTTTTTTTMKMSSTGEEQAQSVMDGKMITEEEATIRKVVGAGIGVLTAVAFLTHDPTSYTSLSSGTFAALATYRTGAQYQ